MSYRLPSLLHQHINIISYHYLFVTYFHATLSTEITSGYTVLHLPWTTCTMTERIPGKFQIQKKITGTITLFSFFHHTSLFFDMSYQSNQSVNCVEYPHSSFSFQFWWKSELTTDPGQLQWLSVLRLTFLPLSAVLSFSTAAFRPPSSGSFLATLAPFPPALVVADRFFGAMVNGNVLFQ